MRQFSKGLRPYFKIYVDESMVKEKWRERKGKNQKMIASAGKKNEFTGKSYMKPLLGDRDGAKMERGESEIGLPDMEIMSRRIYRSTEKQAQK